MEFQCQNGIRYHNCDKTDEQKVRFTFQHWKGKWKKEQEMEKESKNEAKYGSGDFAFVPRYLRSSNHIINT